MDKHTLLFFPSSWEEEPVGVSHCDAFRDEFTLKESLGHPSCRSQSACFFDEDDRWEVWWRWGGAHGGNHCVTVTEMKCYEINGCDWTIGCVCTTYYCQEVFFTSRSFELASLLSTDHTSDELRRLFFTHLFIDFNAGCNCSTCHFCVGFTGIHPSHSFWVCVLS